MDIWQLFTGHTELRGEIKSFLLSKQFKKSLTIKNFRGKIHLKFIPKIFDKRFEQNVSDERKEEAAKTVPNSTSFGCGFKSLDSANKMICIIWLWVQIPRQCQHDVSYHLVVGSDPSTVPT